MKLNIRKNKSIIIVIAIFFILAIFFYNRKTEQFDDDEYYEHFNSNKTIDENLFPINNGHASNSMLRHGAGASVASSAMTKPQGVCCVHYGCVSCGGKYPNQKKFGCKKWVKCENAGHAKHDYQSGCTGCGGEKNAILSKQKDNWW